MKLSRLKLIKIEETLKDFKCLLSRYREVKGNPKLLKEFCSRNRNPIWDITNVKFFDTGLSSKKLITQGGSPVKEHYIQRVRAMEIIFDCLDQNPDMSLYEFIGVLKKYSSTISLTKEEHKLVTIHSRGGDVINYQIYEQLDIEVPGLLDILN